MSTPVKTQKLIYHLTSIENLESILVKGLLSRKRLSKKNIKITNDIADAQIIEKRDELGIEQYVPFHFFAKNPFDGKVIKSHPTTHFCYIILRRTFAERNNFKILTKHPLSYGCELIDDYKQGFENINWDLLEKRDYSDSECKATCMAECLSPKPINPRDISFIWVKNQNDYDEVCKIVKRTGTISTRIVNIQAFAFCK